MGSKGTGKPVYSRVKVKSAAAENGGEGIHQCQRAALFGSNWG